jgi:DNA-binding MarR family transcriptional regulator
MCGPGLAGERREDEIGPIINRRLRERPARRPAAGPLSGVAPTGKFRHVPANDGSHMPEADVDEAATETEQAPARTSPDTAPLRLEEFLPYRLNVLANLVSQALSRIYVERYGLGVPEWRVLVTLGQFGVMTGKAIGAHSHMHKTKVSRAVAELEKRKLIGRRANRADLRESFLSLAPAGRAIYEELAPGALEFARRLAEVVDPADRPAFERAMQRLTERSRALAAEVAKMTSEEP